METEIDKLNKEQLENLGEVLSIFMDRLHPASNSKNWILDFYLKFNPTELFKWVGFIDRVIDLPFPTITYRDKAHRLGELLQHRFDTSNIPVKIRAPLFLFIGTFYQIFDNQSLIYLHYNGQRDKISAIIRLDPYLKSHTIIDGDSQIIGLVPGFTNPLRILDYILDLDVIELQSLSLFTARLHQLPSALTQIRFCKIFLYAIENRNHLQDTETVEFTYL